MAHEFGIIRISTAVPRVSIADPEANTETMLAMLDELAESDIVVFPELAISGYSCGRLFHQQALLEACEQALIRLAESHVTPRQLLIVGLPLRCGGSLYNCAAVINNRRIIGIVPKQYIPNYNEFYEARYFAAGHDHLPEQISLGGHAVPLGIDLLFTASQGSAQAAVHVEICEAMWMPIPPSSAASLAGANIICNPSASPETIGKADFRRMLVQSQSARCLAAYAYSASAATESTADLVFGGHSMIAENGHLVAESTRVGNGGPIPRDSYAISADIDIERLQTERRTTTSFEHGRHSQGPVARYRHIAFSLQEIDRELLLAVPALPFVPANPDTLAARCAEVFGIQSAALVKRLECLGPSPRLSIGISGGLDSTLALLVAVRSVDVLGLPRNCIQAVTMPGFGTTDHTLGNARTLMQQLGVQAIEIDIREAALLEFRELSQAIGYRPFDQIDMDQPLSVDAFVEAIQAVPAGQRQDLVFENVQARRRTELLMNMGFVLGTGDMSELWLGWCTYNADHQSMYNVNCSVPKTLVRFLVEYVAQHEFDGAERNTLMSVAGTAISPELLPPDTDGNIAQHTEATVGPYELHDFFMFNIARYGYSPRKVLYLARHASGWSREYTDAELARWLRVNIKRAFAQQYKRDDVPNGPKVGSLSLSPRGDWRMPSDASARAWLAELD